ncbi:hypothetical protein A2118_03130 [Candidatus Kaiserbacteria bacterium GWA2_50_9]|uniref:Uncharacterized protein n=1 Tax=Candidatus Kaiserbacteria bacterium GWA2_50_9 TaxID=1798474 RepID=A0A1F6BVN9_9BACT|nr:MAG: hypothetical protein A2118_03130 [Candidatus Kaiserbacteria bacterium GWA2_50_9]
MLVRSNRSALASFSAIVAVALVGGLLLAPSLAFAAHTAVVTVSPMLVKGGSSGTYSFSVANDSGSANFIYFIKVTAPVGFAIDGSLTCPTGWTSSNTSSIATCTGDPDPGVNLGIAAGAQATVSFSATAPGTDSTNPWVVLTKDNAFAQQTSNPVTIVDATAPTIFAAIEQDTNGDGKIDKVSVTFSESIKDSTITASQFALAGTPFDGYTTGTANDDEVDFTVSAGVAGTEQKEFTYTAGSLTDLADNSMTSKDAAAISEQDSAAPVMVSAQTITTTRIDTTWSENIDGTTVNDSGTEFTVTGFAVSVADDNSDNIVELTVATMPTGAIPGVTFTNIGTFKDLNGNEAITPTTVTAADGIAPTFTAARTAINTIVLTFSENVTSGGVDTDSFTVAGASAVSAGTVVGDTSITLTTTGLTTTDGTPAVNYVAANGDVADTTTNEVADGGAVEAADQVAPTVAITSTATSPTNDSPIPMTVTFSETVTGFDIDDITVGNGTKADFAVSSGSVYTFNVASPGQGTVTADVAGSVAQDTALNNNSAAMQFSITFDSVAPDITSIVLADPALKVGETSLVTITFTEAVTGFDNTDITTIENGTLSAVADGGAGTVWTATFTPTNAITDDTNVITITKTGIADLAGNAGVDTTSSGNYAIDTVRPTVEVTMGAATFKVGETTTVTFTFSEAPADFTASDVTVGSGAIGEINATNPLIQTATFTPTANTEDTENVITVGTAWTDIAGNTPLAGDDSPNYTIDTKKPSVVLASVTANPTNGLIAVTAQFSESVTGFDATDVTVGNGAVENFVAVDGDSYTFNVNPTDGASFAVTIDVLADKAIDTATNNNTESNPLAYTSDTVVPTVTSIVPSLTTITEANVGTDTFTITINYSEAMNTATAPQIPLDPALEISGTLVGNNGASGWFDSDMYVRHYNVLDINETAVGVDISVTTATDLAGNTQTAGSSANAFDVDTAAPSAPSTPDLAAASDSNITTDNITSNTTPTFIGTAESGSTVTVYDTNGTTVIGSGTATGGNYSVVVSTLSSGVHSITAKTTDTAGNVSLASTALSVTVDTATPTVSFSLPAADAVVKGTTIKLTSTASDDLSGVTCQYKIGPEGSYVTVSCVNDNADLTDAGFVDGRNTFYLKATDGAGNSSEENVSFVIDTNNTLTVDGADDADFMTIQEAITKATTGDTIDIAIGDYEEDVVINKSLVLTGTDDPTTASFTLDSGAVLTGSSGITAETITVESGARIQDGVLLVSGEGTVTVTAGTYAENVSIDSKPNITIQGVGDTTIVEPATGIGFAITDSDGVTIKSLKIHTTGTNAHGIWVAGTPNSGSTAVTGLTVQSTTIVVDGYSAGIYAERVDTAPHSGWLIGGEGTGNVITINTGTGGTGDGMDLHDVSASEVSYNTITLNDPVASTNVLWTSELSNLTNLVFSNNTVSGSSGSEVAIVPNFILTSNTSTITTVTVSGNTFSNWGSRALRIGSGATSVTVSGNKFLVTSVAEILKNEDDVASVNAEANWWGYATGPAADAVITDTGAVDYRPWYLSEADLDNSVLDATAPTVALTNSANLVGVGSMTITATYSEDVAGTPQISINQLGTTDISNANMSGSGAVWTYDYTVTAADGSAYVDGTAAVSLSSVNDPSGNIAGSPTGSVTFTIDTVAPVTSVTAPAGGGSYNGNINITANASDASGIQKVEFYHNSAETLIFTDTTSPYEATWDSTGTSESSHSIYVKAYDNAGNVSTSATVSITLDRTAPAVSITSIAGDNYINNAEKAAIHVVGTAEADSTVNVSLTNGVTVSGSGTASGGNFDITIDGSTLSNGTVTPSVTATDAAGNVSAAVITPTATKDISAPSVTSKTPGANAVGIDPAGNITVVFSENATISAGNVSGVTADVTGSGTDTATINPTSDLATNTTYTITLTGVTDTAGNVLPTTSWSFTTSGSYSIDLTNGWNLISLPVVPTDTDASAVLGALDVSTTIDSVWKYNPVVGTWGAYHPGSQETSSFSTMTAGEGYWVSYLSSTPGTIAGTGNLFQEGNSTPPQKTLAAGWNLIGYYQLENTTTALANNALSTVSGQWTQLRTYNNTTKQFQSVIGTNSMGPGAGYWIFMKSSSFAPYLYGPGDTDPEA